MNLPGYMKLLCGEDARLEFRWRTMMLDTRGTMGGRYKSKACPHCQDGTLNQVTETQEHLLSCSAYSDLRGGSLDIECNVTDRARYLRGVVEKRKGLELDLKKM